jgi:hypothetical protein
MLDGHQVAVIPPGQTRTVTTTPGDHELYIRIRRKKMSRTLSFHLRRDDEITVRCGRPRTAFEGLVNLLRFKRFEPETVIPVELIRRAQQPAR